MPKKTSIGNAKTGGDDLDDGLELEAGFLASDSEAESSSAGSLRAVSPAGSQGEDGFVYDGDDLDEDNKPRRPAPVAGSKRKAASPELGEEARKAEQRKKRRQKDKERKAKKREQRETEAAELDPCQLSPDQLNEILLTSIRETFPAATPIEIDDLRIPIDHLLPPFEAEVQKEGEFAAVQARITALLKSTQNKKLSASTPRVIILCLSGIRCADVVRGVRDIKAPGGVAKLFAKHFKLKDQVAYLATAKVSIAVGTPARVAKLVEEGALKVTKDTVVLLDVGHRDSKTRTLLTSPEVRTELWRSFFSGTARKALLDGLARVAAF